LGHGERCCANQVARQTVVAPYRPGEQTQNVHRPVPRSEDAGLAKTRVWLLQNLDAPLSIDRMASHASMSRRSFTRTFRDETGVSPLQWVLYQRIDLARRLLEATDEPIEEIPARCGFETAAAFRTQFRRFVGTTPSAYREKARS
jgi:transcriptional regulator GlxA family with amidase domain